MPPEGNPYGIPGGVLFFAEDSRRPARAPAGEPWYGTRRERDDSRRGRTPVSLGTATPGGGFPVYGEAVAAILNEVDPTLNVRSRNTKGSTENVPLLEAGGGNVGM